MLEFQALDFNTPWEEKSQNTSVILLFCALANNTLNLPLFEDLFDMIAATFCHKTQFKLV